MADTDTVERIPGEATTVTPVTSTPADLEPPKITTRPSLITPEFGQRILTGLEERTKSAEEAQTKIAESAGREEEIIRHRTETLAPARREVEKSIEEELRVRQANPPQPPAALPERPKLRYNLAEIMGPPGSDKPINKFMSQIGVLAAISGRTPQERMLLAVTAFNGMIDGWAKGKQEDFQQKYNEWKDEVANIRDTETRRRQYIQDVLNDSKASTDLKSLKLQVLGQEDGDRLLVEAAVQKRWQAIDQGNEQYFKGVERLVKTAESIQKAIDVGTREFSDEALRQRVDMMLNGFPPAEYQRGIRAGSSDESRFSAMATAEQARQGITASDLIDRQALRAGRIAGGRLAGSAPARTLQQLESLQANVEQGSAKLVQDLDYLAFLASRVTPGGIKLVNRAIREGKSAVNDVRANQLLTQYLVVQPELARTLTVASPTGVLTVDARKEVREFFDKGASVAVLQGMSDVFKRDLRVRLQEIRNQKNRELEKLHLPPEPPSEVETSLPPPPTLPPREGRPATAAPAAPPPAGWEDLRTLAPGITLH